MLVLSIFASIQFDLKIDIAEIISILFQYFMFRLQFLELLYCSMILVCVITQMTKALQLEFKPRCASGIILFVALMNILTLEELSKQIRELILSMAASVYFGLQPIPV